MTLGKTMRKQPQTVAQRSSRKRRLHVDSDGLSVQEAADKLGVGRTLMYRLVIHGDRDGLKVDSLKIEGRRVVPPSALDRYREARMALDLGADRVPA